MLINSYLMILIKETERKQVNTPMTRKKQNQSQPPSFQHLPQLKRQNQGPARPSTASPTPSATSACPH